jgi:hypothetical protein
MNRIPVVARKFSWEKKSQEPNTGSVVLRANIASAAEYDRVSTVFTTKQS